MEKTPEEKRKERRERRDRPLGQEDNLSGGTPRDLYGKITRGPRKGMYGKSGVQSMITSATLKLARLRKEPKPNLPEETEPKGSKTMKFKIKLQEKILTAAEKRKREEIAQAIERDNPGMPMDKKMAIATATAKKVAEETDLRQQYKDNERDNNHTENALMLAKHFGTPEEVKTVEAAMAHRDEMGGYGANPAGNRHYKNVNNIHMKYYPHLKAMKEEAEQINEGNPATKQLKNKAVAGLINKDYGPDVLPSKSYGRQALKKPANEDPGRRPLLALRLAAQRYKNSMQEGMAAPSMPASKSSTTNDLINKLRDLKTRQQQQSKGNRARKMGAALEEEQLAEVFNVGAIISPMDNLQGLKTNEHYVVTGHTKYPSPAGQVVIHHVKGRDGREHTLTNAHMIAKQIKENNDGTEADRGEYDYEGDMAMSQLKSIIRNAMQLHKIMKPDDNLPEWVQSKITLAKDYIETAANYMMSEKEEGGDDMAEAEDYKRQKAEKSQPRPGQQTPKYTIGRGKPVSETVTVAPHEHMSKKASPHHPHSMGLVYSRTGKKTFVRPIDSVDAGYGGEAVADAQGGEADAGRASKKGTGNPKMPTLVKANEEVWDKPMPASERQGSLSSEQKAKARARAKAAGRPYPNMVDNIWASRQ